MSDATILAIQGVAVAALVFLGQYVVARLSKRAQHEQTEVDSQGKAVEAWESYSLRLEARLEGLESRLEDAERRHNENRRRINALERQRDYDHDLIRRLAYRLRWAISEIRRLDGKVPPSYEAIVAEADGMAGNFPDDTEGT